MEIRPPLGIGTITIVPYIALIIVYLGSGMHDKLFRCVFAL